MSGMTHDSSSSLSLRQTSSPQSRWQKSRGASLLFFTLPTIVIALHGTHSAAWVIPVVTRPQWRQQTTSRVVGKSAPRGADPGCTGANRRRCRPPFATSTPAATATTTTALQSTDSGGEEEEGSGAVSTRRSWQEQFASLRNDAADPWSASSRRSVVGDGSTDVRGGTSTEQTESLAAPAETDDGIEEQATDTAGDGVSQAPRVLVASEKGKSHFTTRKGDSWQLIPEPTSFPIKFTVERARKLL